MKFVHPRERGQLTPLAQLQRQIILTQFEALGLSEQIVKSIDALGFDTPTPIQKQAIPLVLQGRDLTGLAQTGTGKTAAFGLPLVHHLLAENVKAAPKSARALILAPTRELVNQIAENLRTYVRGTSLRITLVIGGASINTQRRNMERGTDILVATPGRLLDLVDRNAVRLDSAKYLVLDEADQMLDLGFIHALRQIAKLLGKPRQTLLFSATMPKQVETLSRAYQIDPVRVETNPPGRAADKVNQSVHFVSQRNKTDKLKDCLIERRDDLSLVFARTKHGAEKLMKHLVAAGFKASSIHGNKSQGQRDRAIKAFKAGEIRILVATDVAARGIDISGVTHVYNYDLPDVAESYVHRIGRTARAGAAGEAVAFCSAEEIHLLRAIENLIVSDIRIASGDVPEEGQAVKRRGRGGNGQRNGGGRNGQNAGPKRNGRPAKGSNGGGRRKSGEVRAGDGDAAAPKKHGHISANTSKSKPGFGKGGNGNRHKPAHANTNNGQPAGAAGKRRRPRRKPIAA